MYCSSSPVFFKYKDRMNTENKDPEIEIKNFKKTKKWNAKNKKISKSFKVNTIVKGIKYSFIFWGFVNSESRKKAKDKLF